MQSKRPFYAVAEQMRDLMGGTLEGRFQEWLDDLRKRFDREGNADGQALLSYVDKLLEQLVMDEKRREAVAAVLEKEGGPVTFTCHACGDRRPDRYISVAHRKVTGLAPAGAVCQINGRYCNDRPDCLRRIPDWLDRVALPLLKERGNRPVNMDRPPLRVHHVYLQPLDGLLLEPGPGYKAICPFCGGLLPVYRNQETMVLSRRDRCVRCGQMFIYLDEKICGEPLEPLDAETENIS